MYLDSYVWDGAQILSEWRVRGPGGTNVGRVTYTHGPGIDAPVSLWHGGTTMVLHANRGGIIDMATYTDGTRVDPDPYTWAGLQSPLYPRYASRAIGTPWLGSLVANKHDGSGLVYVRNRYLNRRRGSSRSRIRSGWRRHGPTPAEYFPSALSCPRSRRRVVQIILGGHFPARSDEFTTGTPGS